MTTTTTTFTKLRSGDWGVRGPLAALDLGAGSSRCVTVAKKDGTVTTVDVVKIVWTDGTTAIAATRSDRPDATTASIPSISRIDEKETLMTATVPTSTLAGLWWQDVAEQYLSSHGWTVEISADGRWQRITDHATRIVTYRRDRGRLPISRDPGEMIYADWPSR